MSVSLAFLILHLSSDHSKSLDCCCSVSKLCPTLCDTRDYSLSWSLLKFMSIGSVIQSNHIILCCPLLLLPLVFPRSGSFPMSWLFGSGGQNIGASTSVFPIKSMVDFLQDWLIWYPCNLKDFQKSSPAPQFKIITSWGLNLLYGPTLTSVHDY